MDDLTNQTTPALRSVRWMLIGLTVLGFDLVALAPSVAFGMLWFRPSQRHFLSDGRLFAFQAGVDVAFTTGLVLALIAARTRNFTSSWRLLRWAGGAQLVGLAVWIASAIVVG